MFKKLKTKIKQLAADPERSPGRRRNESKDSVESMDPQMLEYVHTLAANPQIPRSNLDDQLVKRHLDYQRLKKVVELDKKRQAEKERERAATPPPVQDNAKESIASNQAEARWGPGGGRRLPTQPSGRAAESNQQAQHANHQDKHSKNQRASSALPPASSTRKDPQSAARDAPMESSKSKKKKKSKKDKDQQDMMYLDADEDHMDGNDQMSSLIDRQNSHKLRYLTQENQQLKQLLEDAENGIQINKNMIRILVEHQENQHGASRANVSHGNINPNISSEPQNIVIEKLNYENYSLYKQITELRKKNDALNGDILLKNQIIEENRINAINEIQHLESEYEGLQFKYDRKELILQNLERKLNYYEMYITKQASKYGRNDKEADILLKKFQHEKFSGGIESTELYKLQRQDESKLSNVVQENIELKKQNADLKSIIDEMGYIRNIHLNIIDKCKKTMESNETMRLQLQAQETMIKDLVGQMQQQKKEGAELIAQNLKLTDQVLQAQQDADQVRLEGEHAIKQLQLQSADKFHGQVDLTPEKIIKRADLDDDLDLNFDEENFDVQDRENQAEEAFVGYQNQGYQTQKVIKQHSVSNFEQVQDGLPTILEQSATADLQDPSKDLYMIRSKTHYKKQSEIIDASQFKTTDIGDKGANLKQLRLSYKHKRMQSKHALVNHYKSLSLMQGDDFANINKAQFGGDNDPFKHQKEEFDDISSIYTAQAANLMKENTLKKRVHDRQLRISMMQEGDVEDLDNMKKQIESIQNMDWNEKEFNEGLQQNLDKIQENAEERSNMSKSGRSPASPRARADEEQNENVREPAATDPAIKLELELIENKLKETRIPVQKPVAAPPVGADDEDKDAGQQDTDKGKGAIDLNQACADIVIDKSSMNESEIEKNLESYDYKNYKGMEEDKKKLQYSTKKMNLLGVSKGLAEQYGVETAEDNVEKENLVSADNQESPQKPTDQDSKQVYSPTNIEHIKKQINFKQWIKEGEDLCRKLDQNAMEIVKKD